MHRFKVIARKPANGKNFEVSGVLRKRHKVFIPEKLEIDFPNSPKQHTKKSELAVHLQF